MSEWPTWFSCSTRPTLVFAMVAAFVHCRGWTQARESSEPATVTGGTKINWQAGIDMRHRVRRIHFLFVIGRIFAPRRVARLAET